MKKIKLSAIIVAKNEEENLPNCLSSLDWVDEIVLVDNNSTDNTAKIAQKYNASVHKLKTGDFSQRKNYAAKLARHSWFLFIDADEQVSPELKQEIINTITNPKPNIAAYAIPRKNIILGKHLKRGWWPDYVVRLFKKDQFISWRGKLHEQPVFKGELGYLKNPLIHQKHDNLEEMVEKTNQWSAIEARLMYDAGHPQMNIARFLSAMTREFWLRFVKQRAFLDGSIGIIYALYQVYSRFISYAKLWEMQIKDTN